MEEEAGGTLSPGTMSYSLCREGERNKMKDVLPRQAFKVYFRLPNVDTVFNNGFFHIISSSPTSSSSPAVSSAAAEYYSDFNSAHARVHRYTYQAAHLQNRARYEALVQAKNKFGWSDQVNAQ